MKRQGVTDCTLGRSVSISLRNAFSSVLASGSSLVENRCSIQEELCENSQETTFPFRIHAMVAIIV